MLPMLLLLSLFAPAADDKKDAPPLKLSDDEKALLNLTNAERAKEKLPPLTANPLLFQAARGHSANMAKKGEMKHVLDGKGVEQRLDDLKYDWHMCGENIGWSDGASLAEIMKGWMNSKAHRDHILSPDFTEIGIGIGAQRQGRRLLHPGFRHAARQAVRLARAYGAACATRLVRRFRPSTIRSGTPSPTNARR